MSHAIRRSSLERQITVGVVGRRGSDLTLEGQTQRVKFDPAHALASPAEESSMDVEDRTARMVKPTSIGMNGSRATGGYFFCGQPLLPDDCAAESAPFPVRSC